MSKKNLNFDELCRRYAKALMSLNNNKKKIDESMDSFLKLMDLKNKNADFEYFLSSPLISPIKKIKILEKISKKLNISNTFSNFLKTLADHNRLFAIEKIYNFYKNMIQEEINETNIEIISSINLKNEIKDKLKNEISTVTGKKIKIINIVDKNILGGLIIKINSLMIDSSIKTKLNKYEFSMKGMS